VNELVRLWPKAPPTTIEYVPPEVTYTMRDGLAAVDDVLQELSDPTLTVFEPLPDTSNGIGVIVVPGGEWTINAWDHEGLQVAEWLTALGYTVFVLKHRLQASPADPEEFAMLQSRKDGIHAGPIPHARKPEAISELVSTERYLRARAACADDGRRAIEIVRAEAGRFGL